MADWLKAVVAALEKDDGAELCKAELGAKRAKVRWEEITETKPLSALSADLLRWAKCVVSSIAAAAQGEPHATVSASSSLAAAVVTAGSSSLAQSVATAKSLVAVIRAVE
jgi:hypothetical protein